MAHTKPKFATDACRALERDVNKLAGAVRVTLGPRGQYVVLDQAFGTPTITNDGVTVARQVELEDVFELQRAPSWWWGGHQDQRRCRRPDHDSPRAGPEDR